MGNEDETQWKDAIISTLQGSGDKKTKLPVKELRKAVLLSLQLDTSDKSSKKQFKKVVQILEDDGTVSLNAEGIVKLKKKKSKKKRKTDVADDDEDESPHKKVKVEEAADDDKDGDADDQEGDAMPQHQEQPSGSKNKICKGNPQGVTRLFLGNLPFAVDEASLNEFMPGTVTHIKWITDKETGKFYGSAFIEMDNSTSAAAAVAKAGQQLMGRPIKVNFAPSRPGDIWPPVKKVVSGGGQAGGSGIKAMSEKPENCTKLFIGNLSYDIDDDGITKFFANVDAEVKAVRWLHHKDSGDFKGVGYVEFWNVEACEKAAALNGKNLLERPIRIDWTD